jgi:hypothetical protein
VWEAEAEGSLVELQGGNIDRHRIFRKELNIAY